MRRLIAFLTAAFAIASICVASDGANPTSARTSIDTSHSTNHQLFAQEVPARSVAFYASLNLKQPNRVAGQQSCCKVCKTGKACGDTCISRREECRVGPGCACDG
jgi:hypothetical protein